MKGWLGKQFPLEKKSPQYFRAAAGPESMMMRVDKRWPRRYIAANRLGYVAHDGV